MGYIRFLLALSVVLSHAGALPIIGRMSGGTASVQCFFMLSGFYMALVLSQNDNTLTFYRNRFSRIYSGFWIASAFAFIMSTVARDNILLRIYSAEIPWPAKALALFSNAFLFGSDLTLFVDAPATGIQFATSIPSIEHPVFWYLLIPPAWSLPVELCFYIVAPFALKSLPRMLTLLAASIAVRLWTYSAFGNVDPWGYRFMPSELAFFLAGAISFRFLPLAMKAHEIIGKVLLCMAIAMIVAFEFLPSAWVLYVCVLIGAPFVFARISLHGAATDKSLGEVSYMLYLCHMAVIAYVPAITGRLPITVYLIISVCVAFVLDRYARRLDRWLRNVSLTGFSKSRSV